MSKVLLTTTAAVAGLLLAGAAAGRAAAQDAPANYWSGWYVGANLGGSWADTKLSTTVTPGTGAGAVSGVDAAAITAASHDTANKAGFTGGVQAGYNFLYNQWLFGGEVDWGAMDIRSSTTKPVPAAILPGVVYTVNQEVSAGWLATARARAGWAYDRVLLYGTIGFAWADLKYQAALSSNTSLPRLASESNTTKTGWAGGIGAAYAFTPNWQMRGEWLYADLGNANAAAISGTGATIKPDDNVAANLVRVGLDYRF